MLFFPLSTASHVGFVCSQNSTIYVDDDNQNGPWDGSESNPYCTIQDAIDIANEFDMVFVYSGFYQENLIIDIPLILKGQDKNSTIIDGNDVKDCIYLTSKADGTKISGFTIQHSGNESGGGIFDQGIDIHASETIITNNIIKNHPNNGIWLWCSTNNNISFNIIINNHRAGIEANDCRYTHIYRNIISKNFEWGVMLHRDGLSVGNYVIENTFKDNDYKGMCLAQQAGNYILRNNFINNSGGNARSDFTFFSGCSIHINTWEENYWDDWDGRGPHRISGLFSFDFDWHPRNIPYDYNGGD